nr:uncharacterized protein LOC106684350 [Halyomorpha halys]
MELTSTQALLLSIINCLVTGDIATCSVLAECSYHIQQLRSKHLRIWLREDFKFTTKDMEAAMSRLNALVATGELNLPSHVLTIFSSLADVYRIILQSKENSDNPAQELENAVVDNSKGGNFFDLT